MKMHYKIMQWRSVTEEARLRTWTSQKKHSLQLLSFEATQVPGFYVFTVTVFKRNDSEKNLSKIKGGELSVPAKYYPEKEKSFLKSKISVSICLEASPNISTNCTYRRCLFVDCFLD